MSGMRRAVITGIGVLTPIGLDVNTFWSAALAGKSGIKKLTSIDLTGHSVDFGGECTDFDPGKWMDAKEARRLDRFAQFAIVVSAQAVNDSGIDFSKYDPYKIGVVIGTGVGGIAEMETQVARMIKSGPSRVSPFLIPRLMPNAGSGNVGIIHGARGPNYDITTACASGTHAIGEAARLIRSGVCDVMITGGSEAAITSIGVAGFSNMKALSGRTDDPATASRPFDRDRDGFVIGEGAGGFVLEEYEHAKARGAKIYGEVAGYAATCDAYHITAPDPQGKVAAKTMELALADAKRNKEDVSYISTHSPGTPFGDAMECAALKLLFGSRQNTPPVSGLKSLIGHMLGASGAAAAIAICKAMETGSMHPTINHFNDDPACDVDCIPNTARDIKIDLALTNAFGFGGHNASLAIARV